MNIPFSEYPGRHERHYRRKLNNGLFPRIIKQASDDDLLEVQRLDHEELIDYVTALRKGVQRAVSLKANEESQVVLDLKGSLDRLYEEACGLADQQDNNKAAILQLIGAVMKSVVQGAAGDPQATQELEQEQAARSDHFQLLEQSLVADLLHPESLIEEDELLPALLSESADNLPQVLMMFDVDQLGQLVEDGHALLNGLVMDDKTTEQAQQNLALIEQQLAGQSRSN